MIPMLCFRDSKRMAVYWGMVLVLAFCPFLRVGGSMDFCMRASIPAVMMMYLFSTRSMFLHLRTADGRLQKDVVAIVLAVVLALGAITPAFEICRGFVYPFGVLDDSLRGNVT